MRHRTDIEVLMAEILTKHNIDFVEQFPIRGKYKYVLDFAIPKLKIDIEVDGEHYHPVGNRHDRNRNWCLRKRGWKILRFKGEEIKNKIEECVSKIKSTIIERRKEIKNGN